MKTDVGSLRRQSAIVSSDNQVIAITDDPKLKELLRGNGLVVTEFYPDTTDGHGNWAPTFKIKIALADSQ